MIGRALCFWIFYPSLYLRLFSWISWFIQWWKLDMGLLSTALQGPQTVCKWWIFYMKAVDSCPKKAIPPVATRAEVRKSLSSLTFFSISIKSFNEIKVIHFSTHHYGVILTWWQLRLLISVLLQVPLILFEIYLKATVSIDNIKKCCLIYIQVFPEVSAHASFF